MNIFRSESFYPQETHKRTLFFGRILFKYSRHFDYRNQPLNMLILVYYLDCHEAGLCCYLVVHIENITSIAAIWFRFVTYLLTVPFTWCGAQIMELIIKQFSSAGCFFIPRSYKYSTQQHIFEYRQSMFHHQNDKPNFIIIQNYRKVPEIRESNRQNYTHNFEIT
jgi:hypothetical protein